MTGTFCTLRHYTRFESMGCTVHYTRFESMGCTVLFSVSISFLNLTLCTKMPSSGHMMYGTESNACCLYRYCWRGALPRIFLFKFTCEGGTAQYYVSSQYMYKGEGRSTTIEHVKKQISGGTAYGMDML